MCIWAACILLPLLLPTALNHCKRRTQAFQESVTYQLGQVDRHREDRCQSCPPGPLRHTQVTEEQHPQQKHILKDARWHLRWCQMPSSLQGQVYAAPHTSTNKQDCVASLGKQLIWSRGWEQHLAVTSWHSTSSPGTQKALSASPTIRGPGRGSHSAACAVSLPREGSGQERRSSPARLSTREQPRVMAGKGEVQGWRVPRGEPRVLGSPQGKGSALGLQALPNQLAKPGGQGGTRNRVQMRLHRALSLQALPAQRQPVCFAWCHPAGLLLLRELLLWQQRTQRDFK